MKRKWMFVVASLMAVSAAYLLLLTWSTPYWAAYRDICLGMSKDQATNLIPLSADESELGTGVLLVWEGRVEGETHTVRLRTIGDPESHPVLAKSMFINAQNNNADFKQAEEDGLVQVSDRKTGRVLGMFWIGKNEAIALFFDEAGNVVEKAYVKGRRRAGVMDWLAAKWPF
jgi:hypothetical protein